MSDSPPLPRADRRRLTPSASIVRFPGRRARGVFVYPARGGGWLVTVGGHGWLHSDRRGALDDAR